MLSVLEDMIPAKYRKYVVYILIPLFVLIYGVYQSVQGDWTAFWPALVPAIIGWLVAAPNTHVEPDPLSVPPFDPADQPDPQVEKVRGATDAEAAAASENAVADVSDQTGTMDEEEQ